MPPKAKSQPRAVQPVALQPKSSPKKRKRTEIDVSTTPRPVKVAKKEQKASTNSRANKGIKQEKKDCDICAETKPVYRNFPHVPSCDHDPTVCVECYRKHFKIRIDENRQLGWTACNCPLCGQDFTKQEAQAILPRPFSKQLDASITKIAKQTEENWIWCPAPKCGHGQSHKSTKSPWVKCSKCKSKICIQHQRLWHQGLTCTEFDNMANKDEAAQKDQDFIRTTTKPCKYCHRRIQKQGGCNFITCTGCRKNWLWDEVPFDGQTIATTAEVLGKRGGAPPLDHAERAIVRRVIAAQNAEVDRQNGRPVLEPIPQPEVQFIAAAPALGRFTPPAAAALLQGIMHRLPAWPPWGPLRRLNNEGHTQNQAPVLIDLTGDEDGDDVDAGHDVPIELEFDTGADINNPVDLTNED